jgi:prevent-host-death family protein
MSTTINAKTLRAHLPTVVARVRKGARYTVLYRSRPAFRIVPVEDALSDAGSPLTDDPLYRAQAVGASRDSRTAADHDALLYPR